MRYPIPNGLQRRAADLAKWMRIVGMFQASLGGLGFLVLGVGTLTLILRLGLFDPINLVSLLVLGMLAMLFRQALLLQSAAEHFADIHSEPEDAHDHLHLAFSRLHPVFIIDLVIGCLMLVRNAILLWV